MHNRLGHAPRAYLAVALVGVFMSAGGCSCGPGLQMKVTSPDKTIADGVTPALITVTVTNNNKPVDDSLSGTVKLTTDKGQFQPYEDSTGPKRDDPAQQATSVSLASGTAKIQMYSIHGETHTVNVTYSDSTGATLTAKSQVVFGTNTSTAGSPKTIRFVGANPDHINLLNSGGVTTTEVSFAVVDSSGSPVRDGVKVNFALSLSPGGANIDPPSATTANSTGAVKTVLNAGTIPGAVTVTATVDTDSTITATSTPISIVGSVVNFDDFTLSCDAYSIAGFSRDGLVNNCTVFASDRNKQYVPDTQITFMSEAGGVPQQKATEPEDPATGGRGRAVITYQTQCPWPIDVDPGQSPLLTHEYQTQGDFFNRCNGPAGTVEHRTINNRDGWATLVAYTLGEECFNDINGNGQFDPGEDKAGCDLGEPYLDLNDNGQYDGPGVDPMIPGGEPFYDYDSNGVWTPPNGKWDARWPIWRSVVIVWTGSPKAGSSNAGTAQPVPTPVPGLGTHCGTTTYRMVYSDINGNFPTSDYSGDNVTVQCGSTNCSPPPVPISISGGQNVKVDTSSNSPTGLLPYVDITLTDGHGCNPDCKQSSPPCPATAWSNDIVITRTLDSSQSTTEEHDLPSFNNGTFN